MSKGTLRAEATSNSEKIKPVALGLAVIPSNVTSKIRLYADDVILYREIHSAEDIIRLQKDLDIIAQWAHTWLMKLNLTKSDHLTITNKKNPINSMYNINSHFLSKVNSAKYLGVTLLTTCLGMITLLPFVIKQTLHVHFCKEISGNALLLLNHLLTSLTYDQFWSMPLLYGPLMSELILQD